MTLSGIRHISHVLALCLFAASLPGAQSHVVTPSDLNKAAVALSDTRQQNRETIDRFVSTPRAANVLRTAGMNAEQVKTAVATLDDQELSRLAARARQAHDDFAAGRLSDRDLLIILIGIAALILIIVAVD